MLLGRPTAYVCLILYTLTVHQACLGRDLSHFRYCDSPSGYVAWTIPHHTNCLIWWISQIFAPWILDIRKCGNGGHIYACRFPKSCKGSSKGVPRCHVTYDIGKMDDQFIMRGSSARGFTLTTKKKKREVKLLKIRTYTYPTIWKQTCLVLRPFFFDVRRLTVSSYTLYIHVYPVRSRGN